MGKIRLISIALLASTHALAQTPEEAPGSAQTIPIAPPMGMYCSCPPTGGFSVSVVPGVAELDFVEGILVRVRWGDLEPTQGSYQWSMIDGQLQAARDAGKRVSLAVVNGGSAPGWLASTGVQMFPYSFQDGTPSQLPVPWDTGYLSAWEALVQALGDRYGDEETISLVYITHSTFNGFEMQLPFSPTDQANWASIGYTEDALVASWMGVIDSFAEAFPRHALSFDVHPVLRSDAVAQRVAEYADKNFGGRVGLLGAWWMTHNARDAYPGMFELLKNASFRSHSEVQVANSFTNTPERFETGSIQGEIDLAMGSGIRYMEIWNSDLLNTGLQPLLRDAAARLLVPFGDANADGFVDIEDVHHASRHPEDVNGDGVADSVDLAIITRKVRAREAEDMTRGR